MLSNPQIRHRKIARRLDGVRDVQRIRLAEYLDAARALACRRWGYERIAHHPADLAWLSRCRRRHEDPRERAIAGHGVVTGCDEDLDADMVGAGVEVRRKSRVDAFGCAVEHERIDETVAATAADVLGCEAVAEATDGRSTDALTRRATFRV